MSGAGIGNDLRIGEVGGIGNLFPSPKTDKFFNLKVNSGFFPQHPNQTKYLPKDRPDDLIFK